MTKRLIASFAAVIIALGGYWFLQQGPAKSDTGPFSSPAAIKGPIDIIVPETLGGMAALGAPVFARNCAACHGDNGAGSESGPPLVHVIYEPNHHGDGSFYMAVAKGVRAHHWRFGNMMPVDGVSETEVRAIIAYIRTLQRANGVE